MDFSLDSELAVSGTHHITQRPEPIDGTACSIYYSLETLRHDRSIANETSDIIGLQACKTALNNMVLLPERAPQHYITGTGFLQRRTNLMMYGGKGSGKKSLNKTYCAEHCLNLIFVSYAGFRAATDIPCIMQKAATCQPCIVLYDDCISEFRQNRDPRNIGAFQAAQYMIRDRGLRVWNVFTTVEMPYFNPSDGESLHHAFYDAMHKRVWTGDTENHEYNPALSRDHDLLSEPDRLAVFVRAIGRYHNNDPTFVPLSQPELAQLVAAASYCTAGNIVNFVNKLCLEQADRTGISEMIVLDTNSPTLMPTYQTFLSAIEANQREKQGGYITPFNALNVNIRPYSPAFQSGWDDFS